MRAHLMAVPPVSTSNRQRAHPVLENWLESSDDSRLHQQIASEATLPGSDQYKNAEYRGAPPSAVNTSQDLVGGTNATAYDSLPGLSNSDSSSPVESVATSMGERELIQSQRLLRPDPNQDGALTAIPHMLEATLLECPLRTILDCRSVFNTNHEGSWIDHSLVHFKTIHGQVVQPPKTAKCCFCGRKIQRDTGKEAWISTLKHIREAHYLNGHRSAAARPDFELVHYLWGTEVINTYKYRDLTAPHSNISPPNSPNTESLPPVSNVQERRRDRPMPSYQRDRR